MVPVKEIVVFANPELGPLTFPLAFPAVIEATVAPVSPDLTVIVEAVPVKALNRSPVITPRKPLVVPNKFEAVVPESVMHVEEIPLPCVASKEPAFACPMNFGFNPFGDAILE
jgi:hypothetical protein